MVQPGKNADEMNSLLEEESERERLRGEGEEEEEEEPLVEDLVDERNDDGPALPAKMRWDIGQEVEAVWLEDEVFYLAEIVRYEGDDMYEVVFTEYGNRQKQTPLEFIRDLTPEDELSMSALED